MLTEQDKNALSKKLIDAGLLTPEQLVEVHVQSSKDGISLPQYLVRAGLVPKAKVYEALAAVYGVPYVDVANFQISPEAIQSIPGELAHRYNAIPLFKIANSLNVAMENPTDVSAIDHLARKARCTIDVCLGALEDIAAALKEHYGAGSSVNELIQSLTDERRQPFRSADSKKGPARPFAKPGVTFKGGAERSVVELVDLIIRDACEQNASDIHIEPEEKIFRIRYRVDGVLHEASTPSKELESEIITRIKILAGMDIAETHVPQDGSIKMKIQGKDVDMRVATMPTVYGENIVLRILRDENAVLDLTGLGLSDEMGKIFQDLIRKAYGMILETGPTGSGKTTTLYAALRIINSVERNIVTIEDPVEYKLPLIRQIPVNLKAGLNFANALRSILRQDPDVIMVGEIRDTETAEIAIQSALTGHLVLSTLHTNSAAGAITRLMDMKIEPFLISSSVIGVVSQRLVRRICERCKEPDPKPSDFLLESLKLPPDRKLTTYKGTGCRHCHQTGYRGRIGIFEILKINEAIQKKIVARADTSEIEREARKAGLKSLRDDALDKVAAGITTIEEIVKIVDTGTGTL
ncbi:MAG: Flp pilus assembly complex ATPase component TadA [Candidatus Omnitrophica bacterium]|nr:Flp pilus assembly complex ATPase component TadA [Candidatus Omnitrophota bacterium]